MFSQKPRALGSVANPVLCHNERYMLVDAAKKAVAGSAKIALTDFNLLPSLAPDEEFSVTVRLRRRLPLPRWTGERLTHRRHALHYGADPASLAVIESFASANGLSLVRARTGSRYAVLQGTGGAMQRAFSTELRVAEIDGRKCRVRQGEILVPAALAPLITSVTGLDNRPFAKPHFRIAHRTAHVAAAGAAPTRAADIAFTPLEIASLYNFPADFDGTGQTIAILELDGGFRPAELAAYLHEIDIPQPKVTVVPFAGGGSNNPGSNALDPFCRDAEVMLDLQVVGAMAPGAEILVYFARDDSDESFLAAMSAIIHDSVRKPDIISISWGGPESMATAQFREDFDQLLQTAAHLGITVCVATGDDASPDFGANDPRWDRGAHVDFPASSPWALACGGTRINAENAAIASEEVWFEGPNDGTGGGISRVFPLPDYQKDSSIPRAMAPDGPAMRGIPDVAGNAAPASGFRILCNGQKFPDPEKNIPPMGGTSAVAPMWAALVARMNQALGRRCGFLNPALYRLASAPGSAIFRNPPSGTNGSYFAALGWNPCTGLGSVDGTKLLNAMRAESH
jgi:kumamolisin